MKRDIMNLLIRNLAWLQRFDRIKIYYDSGQAIVNKAIHEAVEFAIAKEATFYRKARRTITDLHKPLIYCAR